MITLTKLSCKYGAPLGRYDQGNLINCTTAAVEWMPFVGGDYDVGGAYFGSGHPIYCVVGYNEDGEEEARQYHRAANRDFLLNDLVEIHCFEGSFLPETGSIVKQTIDFLRESIADEERDSVIVDVEVEIDALEAWLGGLA